METDNLPRRRFGRNADRTAKKAVKWMLLSWLIGLVVAVVVILLSIFAVKRFIHYLDSYSESVDSEVEELISSFPPFEDYSLDLSDFSLDFTEDLTDEDFPEDDYFHPEDTTSEDYCDY